MEEPAGVSQDRGSHFPHKGVVYNPTDDVFACSETWGRGPARQTQSHPYFVAWLWGIAVTLPVELPPWRTGEVKRREW